MNSRPPTGVFPGSGPSQLRIGVGHLQWIVEDEGTKEVLIMNKKYVVRLTEQERDELAAVIKNWRFAKSSQTAIK